MREKIAKGVGIAGFLLIAGATGGFEQDRCSVAMYLCLNSAGFAMMAASKFWYDYQGLKSYRRRNSLKHRRMQYENGIKGRSDSY